MNKVLSSLLVVTTFAVATMGQTRLNKEESAHAWAAVGEQKVTKGVAARAATTSIPSIVGAAVVTEPQVNSWGERFHAAILSSGTYLVQGVMCDGFPIRMGEWWYEIPANGYGSLVVLDTAALAAAAPGMQAICQVQLFRLNNGEVSGVSIGVPPQLKVSLFEVVGEGLTQDKEYLVAVRGEIDPRAEVVLGRHTRPIRREKFITGETRFFFSMNDIAPVGALTITVCQTGTCDTKMVPRIPEVWGIPKG